MRHSAIRSKVRAILKNHRGSGRMSFKVDKDTGVMTYSFSDDNKPIRESVSDRADKHEY